MFKDRKALIAALDEFYGSVATRIEQFQEESRAADLYEATGFTVFDYIDPNENCLSDVIYDLLDPSGKHGQGRVFQDLLLEAIGVQHESVRLPFRVKREDCTLYCASPERRIDITLEVAGFGIGIENKPFHYEAEDQLKDYSLHLRQKYGQRFMLVYLSGDGSRPDSIDQADLGLLRKNNQFKNLAYPTGLCHWLERCVQECKAEKVRWFLEEFAEYVKTFELAEDYEEPIHETK
ncbi:MAG: PD-(D/E)XK nuclease family protein [Bryobacteraceae bacterium]|jgi:hypothetical protein